MAPTQNNRSNHYDLITPDAEFTIQSGKVVASISPDAKERKKSFERILKSIAKRQEKFFLHGAYSLAPMTYLDIQKDTGLHESTISVCLKDRFIKTPIGTIPIRSLFGTAFYRTKAGSRVSNAVVKNLIESIVKDEDITSPLSDESIRKELEKEGVILTRRVVAKYRDQIGIPSITERKSE